MTLNVYVDAFNLYYGCLMDTPYKWLNLRTLCELSFPADHVKDIHYFTARIKPNPHDPDKHVRQDTYFRALRTVPGLHIHEGTYSRKAGEVAAASDPGPADAADAGKGGQESRRRGRMSTWRRGC